MRLTGGMLIALLILFPPRRLNPRILVLSFLLSESTLGDARLHVLPP